MPPPFASVVITTFNHERYIAEAIESALAQTFGDREIIVIDDGSTDSTASIVKRYADRIVSIRQANSGVAGSRNRGVREAKGELILLMDGDDTWHPDHVARHVDAFRRFPEAGLIVNDSRYMDGTLVLGPSTLPKTLPGIIATDGNVALCQCGDALVQNNFIWTTSEVSLPRAVVDEIGYSNPAFRVGSDYDLYLRISGRYPIAIIREPLTDYRYVPSAASGSDQIRPLVCGWEAIAVLAHQAKQASPERRALMRQSRARKMREFSRSAYYYGWDHDRAFARRYLWRMLRSSGDWRTALYLGALFMPAAVHRRLAPLGGRLAGHDS